MYSIYGLSVALPDEISSGLEIVKEAADFHVLPWLLDKPISTEVSWYHKWHMPDGHVCLKAGRKNNGSFVLHFIDEGLEFEISRDGREVYYRHLEDPNLEVLRHILFTQVIPLVMNLIEIESIHASSVLNKTGAVVFIGKSGQGKSTLAASLIKNGLKLISDNVVPLFFKSSNIWTTSGASDIGLWPSVWRYLNPNAVIDDPTEKCRVALSDYQHAKGDHILSHVYLLNPIIGSNTVRIEPVSMQETLLQLIKGVFRLDLNDKLMLERQLSLLHKTVQLVKMRKIIYPASIPDPDKLSCSILTDIESFSAEPQLLFI
jgi:hypothetical protein